MLMRPWKDFRRGRYQIQSNFFTLSQFQEKVWDITGLMWGLLLLCCDTTSSKTSWMAPMELEAEVRALTVCWASVPATHLQLLILSMSLVLWALLLLIKEFLCLQECDGNWQANEVTCVRSYRKKKMVIKSGIILYYISIVFPWYTARQDLTQHAYTVTEWKKKKISLDTIEVPGTVHSAI